MQDGPIALARIAPGPMLQLPAAQGFIGIGGVMFQPAPRAVFAIGGPSIGEPAPASMYLGPCFAPGQGGDTPGGGGGVYGSQAPVETNWFVDGIVNPQAIAHPPGVTSWTSSRARRSAA